LLACVLAVAGCDSGGDDGGDGGGSSQDGATAPSPDDRDAGGSDPGSTGSSGRGGSGGNAGSSSSETDAGSATNGGSGAGSGGAAADAGSATTTTGPGIPTDGETACVHENPDLASAFYFGTKKNCTIYKGAMGPFTDQQKASVEALCTGQSGMVVASCPDEPIAAYCAGVEYLPGAVMSNSTKLVYESAVNPDAETVAKNSLAVCGVLSPYDTDDHALQVSCTGTLKAKVDGAEVDFSEQLICLFRTDGVQSAYFISGTFDPKSIDSKTFSLSIRDDGTGPKPYAEALQPPFGYLEGSGASGAFTQPATDPAPSYESSRFEANGDGFAGMFEVTINGGGGTRVFTEGEIDVTLGVK
jgi:hypothetical protein